MSKRSYLYVIAEDEDGPVKIGYSNSARSRLATLQIGNPRTLRIAACWEVEAGEASFAEMHMHGDLEYFYDRLRGEWFAAPADLFSEEYMRDFFLSIGVDACPA
jgi:hypothetical protein